MRRVDVNIVRAIAEIRNQLQLRAGGIYQLAINDIGHCRHQNIMRGH